MAATMRLKDRFSWGDKTYVMGVLNVTPDSFSGDGLAGGDSPVKDALRRAADFLEAGADILDVGGESTRPGAEPVAAEEEMARVLPVIQAIAKAYPDAVISVDTSKASVAARALDLGASIVNDIWALRADAAMAPLVAKRGVPVVLMHNRSKAAAVAMDPKLGGRYLGARYAHLMDEVAAELAAHADAAIAAGIGRDQIILDPGIGFGKTVAQNLALINHLDRLKTLGFPLLIGPSRKSFIGQVLDVSPDDREEGTAAAVAVGIVRGADVVRVHDLRAMARIARMVDAIMAAPADGGSASDRGAA